MSGPDESLTDLVGRLQADPEDEQAQRELHDRYRVRLVGFCRGKLRDRDSAEDCAQEAFQDVFAGIGELRDPGAFESWMFTIATKKVSRYNSGLKHAALPIASDDELPDLPDPVTDVEHSVRMRELLTTIGDAIDGMQPPLNTVMRVFINGGGLRGSELADRLGWTTAKADHELNRARSRLLEALEALVVVRSGRDACARLNELCARQRVGPGRKTRLNREQRRHIHRHIAGCDVCRPTALAARDRGRWALGPGIAQLADHLRRRSRTRLAAAVVLIAMVALPATGDLVQPGHSPKEPVAISAPRRPAPAPTATPPPSQPPPTRSPTPQAPTRRPTRAVPIHNGGGSPPPPRTSPPASPSSPPSRPPTRPPPRPRPPSPTSRPSPARTPPCVTSITGPPLTVQVNAIVLCVTVRV